MDSEKGGVKAYKRTNGEDNELERGKNSIKKGNQLVRRRRRNGREMVERGSRREGKFE